MTDAWRSRIVGYAEVDPRELVANPRNWRTHPDHQRDALHGVLDEVGWVAEVLVNQRTGFVVDGHLRVASAVQHGEQSVPVRYVDLDESEERLVLATLDPLSALASQSDEQLRNLLEDLQPTSAALGSLLRDMSPPVPKQLNPDDADLTPPADPITQPGDLWLLGEHRLLCGDATSRRDVEQLLDGERASLLLTDPPYNVGFAYGETTDDDRLDYPQWSAGWFNVATPYADHAIVTVGCVNLSMWLAQTEPVHVGIWVKGQSATAQSKVTQFVGWEPILFYGAARWSRSRHMDVFEFEAGAVPKLDHPCPKPVALWSEFLLHFSERGDIVLDVFGGTGTSAVAAEQYDRRVRLLEVSPAFCDVIVQRWEHVTGRKAARVGAATEVHA